MYGFGRLPMRSVPYAELRSLLGLRVLLHTRAGHVLHLVRANSASHPSRVAKSSTSLIWLGEGNGGWQVTPCDPTWHVSSRSDEAGGKLLLYSVYILSLLFRRWSRSFCT